MKAIVCILTIFALTFCFSCDRDNAKAQAKEEPPAKKIEPKPVAPLKTIVGNDGIEMVFVPAGLFRMGSDKGQSDEKPVHEVNLNAYYIDRYEVTNSAYRECVIKRKCKSVRVRSGLDGSNQPAVGLSYFHAKQYCKFVGERLPSEAEWEKAAKGIDLRPFPWGGEIDENKAVYASKTTLPVGSKPLGSSPYGALDMAGNAAEWVEDWYDKSYYAKSPKDNPKGPKKGRNKVIRGGSYFSAPEKLTLTYRLWERPKYDYDTYGVRCVKSE